MDEYEVFGIAGTVNFAPGSTVEEVLQNVRTILTTTKYSVPLDREFGLSATMIDEPLPKAMATLSAEIVEALRRFEPRAQVVSVNFSGDGMEGVLVPKVRVRIVADAS